MFYKENDILFLNKMTRKFLIISAIIFLAFVSFVVASIFLINDSNVILFKILFSVFSSTFALFLCYTILNVLLVNNDKKNFIKNILGSDIKDMNVEIISFSDSKILRKNIEGRELICKARNQSFILYIEERFFSSVFKAGTKLNLSVAGNFIVEVKYE